MTVWVLIAVMAGPNFTDVPTNLGTYATQADCKAVISAVRDVQDIRESRFRCIEVQKLPS